MTSLIDPTVPIFGAPTTASIRNNFLIAKNEIEALQGLIPGGGVFGPPINMSGGGTIVLPSASNFFVFVHNLSSVPITVAIPPGLAVGQQVIIKDTGGNAGIYSITISASSTIDGNSTYSLVSNFASLSLVWLGSIWGTF
jgi:hypothetical protein